MFWRNPEMDEYLREISQSESRVTQFIPDRGANEDKKKDSRLDSCRRWHIRKQYSLESIVFVHIQYKSVYKCILFPCTVDTHNICHGKIFNFCFTHSFPHFILPMRKKISSEREKKKRIAWQRTQIKELSKYLTLHCTQSLFRPFKPRIQESFVLYYDNLATMKMFTLTVICRWGYWAYRQKKAFFFSSDVFLGVRIFTFSVAQIGLDLP